MYNFGLKIESFSILRKNTFLEIQLKAFFVLGKVSIIRSNISGAFITKTHLESNYGVHDTMQPVGFKNEVYSYQLSNDKRCFQLNDAILIPEIGNYPFESVNIKCKQISANDKMLKVKPDFSSLKVKYSLFCKEFIPIELIE